MGEYKGEDKGEDKAIRIANFDKFQRWQAEIIHGLASRRQIDFDPATGEFDPGANRVSVDAILSEAAHRGCPGVFLR